MPPPNSTPGFDPNPNRQRHLVFFTSSCSHRPAINMPTPPGQPLYAAVLAQLDEEEEIDTEEIKITAMSPAVIDSALEIKTPRSRLITTTPHNFTSSDSPYDWKSENGEPHEYFMTHIPTNPLLPKIESGRTSSHLASYSQDEDYAPESDDSDWDHLSSADISPPKPAEDIYTSVNRAIAQTRRLANTTVARAAATATGTRLPAFAQPLFTAADRLYTSLTTPTAPVNPRDLRVLLRSPYPSQPIISKLESRGLIRVPLNHPMLERIFAMFQVTAMATYPLWVMRDGTGWLLYFFGTQGDMWSGWIVGTRNGEQCWCADSTEFKEWAERGLGTGLKATVGRGWKQNVEALGEELESVDLGDGWVW